MRTPFTQLKLGVNEKLLCRKRMRRSDGQGAAMRLEYLHVVSD